MVRPRTVTRSSSFYLSHRLTADHASRYQTTRVLSLSVSLSLSASFSPCLSLQLSLSLDFSPIALRCRGATTGDARWWLELVAFSLRSAPRDTCDCTSSHDHFLIIVQAPWVTSTTSTIWLRRGCSCYCCCSCGCCWSPWPFVVFAHSLLQYFLMLFMLFWGLF